MAEMYLLVVEYAGTLAPGRLQFSFEIAQDCYGCNSRRNFRGHLAFKFASAECCPVAARRRASIRLTGRRRSRTIPPHDPSETRMHPLLKAFGPALLALVLAACNTPPDRQQFPEITFQHLQPFRLDVARVRIVDGAQADPANDIGDQFPEAPAAVARQWGEDRLLAVGSQGEAIYTITIAKATQTPLRRSTGMSAVTHKDQSDRYDLAITVNLEVQSGGKSGAVAARAARSQT